MKKTIIITLVIIALVATAAFASVKTGDRNFERAWRTYVSKQMDKARGHFTAAAQGYGEALKEDPPSRIALFPSTLLKAGIAFYYAGRYQECIDAMEMAHRKEEKKVWEASLFMALSQARMGNREQASKDLEQFRATMSSQRMITNEIQTQLARMGKGEATMEEATQAIENATMLQFSENVKRNRSPRDVFPAVEQCGGTYWWRQNDAPCSRLNFRWD